jgi:hypothetical protein
LGGVQLVSVVEAIFNPAGTNNNMQTTTLFWLVSLQHAHAALHHHQH